VFASKFEKILRLKLKFSVRVSKNAEFYADFKTVGKLLNHLPKNVKNKKVKNV
jgi:hypothetical protein